MINVELWRDYGRGPLWLPTGVAASPAELGLPTELSDRLDAFNAAHEEWKLSTEGAGDREYVEQGIDLIAAVRATISPEFSVVVTEPWWGVDRTANGK